MTVFADDRVRQLRPVYLPPDPASRTSYEAGETAQNDFWFPDITLPVGYGQVRTAKQLPVLTMVTGYSRWLMARLVPSRCAEDLYAGWWQHLSALASPGETEPSVLTTTAASASVSAIWPRPATITAFTIKEADEEGRGWTTGSGIGWSRRAVWILS